MHSSGIFVGLHVVVVAVVRHGKWNGILSMAFRPGVSRRARQAALVGFP
jgi:hypothetical protein